MRHDVDRAIDHVASLQHGVFSRSQALSIGATTRMIEWRLATGRWVLHAPSVYALGSHADTWHQRVMAAVLARSDSMASGVTAAVLHGFAGYAPGSPEITAPFTTNARADGFIVRRCRHFDQLESVMVLGIRCMSPTETIFDLARRISTARLQSTIEHAIVGHTLTIEDLSGGMIRRSSNRCPSVRPVAEIIEALAGKPIPASALERRTYDLLESGGLPPFTRQAPAPWWTSEAQRVDAAIPAWQIIVEADGRAWHSRQQDFERDRERDNRAVAAGWRVLRFTYRMITESPAEVLATIRAAGLRSA